MTEEQRRPGADSGTAATGTHSVTDQASLERRTEMIMRCARLRGAAHALFDAEAAGKHVALSPDGGEMGLLATQLLDFADLIEAVEHQGGLS